MSKRINISGRSDQMQPRMQNIPLRTDLGQKLRQALMNQQPGRVLVNADYSGLEMKIHAQATQWMQDAQKREQAVTRPYAVYMERRKDVFLIAALFNTTKQRWCVYMAWGRTGNLTEKEYDKAFRNEQNAINYAKAIVAEKKKSDFDYVWGPDDKRANSHGECDDAPDWWSDVVMEDKSEWDGPAPVSKPSGIGAVKPTGDEDDEDDDALPPKRDINALKERMEAKVKIEAGKAKIAIKQPPKDEHGEEVKRAAPKPRFQYVPRK